MRKFFKTTHNDVVMYAYHPGSPKTEIVLIEQEMMLLMLKDPDIELDTTHMNLKDLRTRSIMVNSRY